MKAVRIHAFGGPEVLELDEIPIPSAAEGRALVRVLAASINPVDYKMRKGGYPKLPKEALPATLGRDFAGVIDGLSDETAPFRVGDQEFGHLDWDHGAYAEYCSAGIVGLAKMPSTIDAVAAAAVPLAATTAWQGLFDHGHLKAGQTVLIHGGSGGVGGFAVQFAKHVKATVYATASGEGLDLVRAYGADRAIDYKNEEFEDVVSDVDFVLDLIGGETQARSWTVLKTGGVLISTLEQPDEAKAVEKQARAARFTAEPNGPAARRNGAADREFFGKGGILRQGPEDPTFDALYEKLLHTTKQPAQEDVVRETERYIQDQAKCLFLFAPHRLFAVSNRTAFTPYDTCMSELAETRIKG